MEYLRRLAPPRADDASRAVAVLPSRFSGDLPLRATPAEAAPTPAVRDDEPASADAGPVAPGAAVPAQSSLAQGAGPVRTEPPRPGVDPPERGDRAAQALPAVHAGTPAAQAPRDGPRASPPQPALPEAAAAPFEPGPAAPLSPAILAERSAHPAEDNQVVHVSIGRIDVVASMAPPAPPRAPTPRSGTVPLADYLRGDNGSRR